MATTPKSAAGGFGIFLFAFLVVESYKLRG
jgi:hypothetical protein